MNTIGRTASLRRNLDPTKPQIFRCEVKGTGAATLSGEIITAGTINAYSEFGKPEAVNITTLP